MDRNVSLPTYGQDSALLTSHQGDSDAGVQEEHFENTGLFLPLDTSCWTIHVVREGQGCMWNVPEKAFVSMSTALQGAGDG